MIRLCILCGKEAVTGNFCKDCFLQKNKLFEINDLRIILCDNEDNYYLQQWKDFSNVRDMLEDFINLNMKKFGKVERIHLSYKPFKDGYDVKIKAVGLLNKLRKIEEKDIHVSIKKKMCDNCVKISGRYHEAKMQIRGDNLDRIVERVKKMIPKTSWVEQSRHGYDVFFISKSDASDLAKFLRKKFEVKKSFKVVGAKKGKMLMRDVYSIK
ncbi:MAG: hypothetical protein HY831_03820 [Candidatus Aenigmarchaeota archaeon]|nr:hypothetical protein [Candidatus Aenigmarchaeota archaeon]